MPFLKCDHWCIASVWSLDKKLESKKFVAMALIALYLDPRPRRSCLFRHRNEGLHRAKSSRAEDPERIFLFVSVLCIPTSFLVPCGPCPALPCAWCFRDWPGKLHERDVSTRNAPKQVVLSLSISRPSLASIPQVR